MFRDDTRLIDADPCATDAAVSKKHGNAFLAPATNRHLRAGSPPLACGAACDLFNEWQRQAAPLDAFADPAKERGVGRDDAGSQATSQDLETLADMRKELSRTLDRLLLSRAVMPALAMLERALRRHSDRAPN